MDGEELRDLESPIALLEMDPEKRYILVVPDVDWPDSEGQRASLADWWECELEERGWAENIIVCTERFAPQVVGEGALYNVQVNPQAVLEAARQTVRNRAKR
jgi:hypothetical protein